LVNTILEIITALRSTSEDNLECPVGGLSGNLDFSHGAVPKNIHTYPKERFSEFLEIPQRGLKNYSNNYCKSMN